MKRHYLAFSYLFILAISYPVNVHSIPAFPGAEGYGAETVGGRGGDVVKVTNLNDSGPGSFRQAVEAPYRHWRYGTYQYESLDDYHARLEASGHKIVVFDVSGIINLESSLSISYPFITIAGHTSPGGILVTGYQTTIRTHDVIMRHMRYRVGSHRIADGADPEKLDSFDILGVGWNGNDEVYNVIIDHSSFSWGVDETFTVSGGVNSTTIQWSIISEGLSHAGHPKGEHSKGLMVSGKGQGTYPGTTISLHHNYIAHNNARSPLISSPEDVDMTASAVNNVMYNWNGGSSPQSEGSTKINWDNNYAKQGVNSNDYSFEVQHSIPFLPAVPQIYVFGNIGSTRLSQSEPQWNVGAHWRNILLDESYRKLTPWDTPVITTSTMSEAYALEILTTVGATKPVRDSVDARVVEEFVYGTGSIIDDVRFPEDFPVFSSPMPPVDSDNDGMADEWERANHLDTAIDDSANVTVDGYTNIEKYLHQLAGSVDLAEPEDSDLVVILKSDDSKYNKESETISYQVEVSNIASASASNTTLIHTLPSEVMVLSMIADQGSCDNVTLICELGVVTANTTVIVNIIVATTTTKKMEFSASVSSNTLDSDTANNQSTEMFGGAISFWVLSMFALLVWLRNLAVRQS